MPPASEQTQSVWATPGSLPQRAPLAADTRADVCVIGAGIAGLSTAYLLASAGKSVIVLDDGPVGGGQTQRTTAHLSNALDERYFELERVHGAETARLAAESHTAAIHRIELIAREENIECDFRRLDGYLFVPPGESTDTLEREQQAAHRAGLSDVVLMARAPLPSFDTGRALRFPQQGQFHPLKYLTGLAAAIERRGGRIFTNSHVSGIESKGPTTVVIKDGPVVSADAVVVATNSPINDLFAIHTKQAPYLSYAIAAPIPRGSVPSALFWDTLENYHYVRLQSLDDQTDLLIVGGEDHKVGQANDQQERWECLTAWARERFPMMGLVQNRWSGMVMETTDGLAFIGRNPNDKENIYIATGDSGMGMTHGTIAGILLTDLILGRVNPWATIYDPSRKPAWGMAARQFVAENLNVATQYVKDWLGGGDVASADQVSAGQGAVIRRGLTKIAVYRDEQGTVHEHSAVCPHLGCIVHWNGAEKTWDCPCHGSRFDCQGAVINGPANTPLASLPGQAESSRTAAHQ